MNSPDSRGSRPFGRAWLTMAAAGVYSAPLLLAASARLFREAWRLLRAPPPMPVRRSRSCVSDRNVGIPDSLCVAGCHSIVHPMKSTRLLALAVIMAFAAGCATTPRPTPAAADAASANALEIAALDQIPVPRFMGKPDYPSNLRDQRITGSAVIAFIVDTNGDVRDPWVVQATHEEFGLAARQAVSKWKFRPGQKGGRNVNVRMKVPVAFDIQDSTRPAPPADLKSY